MRDAPATLVTTGVSGDDAPILVELRKRLEATQDPVERAVLHLRQGLYLARTERLTEARALPAQVREQWDGVEDLRVYVWLWLLEGVLAFYGNSRTDERLRLLQAHEAALKAGWRAEAELSAAWLAHFAYVDGDYSGMLIRLRASALGKAALDETVARSSLTLACALQWFGQEALASAWFLRAREAARSTGDRAGIMAATANRLMLKLSDNWLSFSFGEQPPHEPELLRQDLLGILGYEELSGSASLQEQNEVARLRLESMKGNHDKALQLTGAMSAAQQRRSDPALALAGVVRCWLQAHAADTSTCVDLLKNGMESLQSTPLDDDDTASSYALLAQVALKAGQQEEAARLRKLADQARQRYQGAILPFLDDLLAVEREATAGWRLG